MGCWNGTCGISQLPITAGTKVKTFLILQSEFAHGIKGAGSCYSTEFFRPWFFPVSAEYNDYGSIENITEDWNSKYMLETFQKWLAEGEVKLLGDDAEINSPGIKKFIKLSDVFDCVERGALVFKNHSDHWDDKQEKWVPTGGYLKIGMFMVLENVFNDLVKENSRFIALEKNSFYAEQDAEDRKKAMDSINKSRIIGNNKTGGKDEFNKAMESFRDIWIDRFLGDLIEEHRSFKHYKTILLYNPQAVTVEDFFAKLDEVIAIANAMTFLRKLWFPQCGQGSQSEELSFNKVLNEAISEHIGHRDAEMEKQEEEYEKYKKAPKKKASKKKAKK